MAFQLPAYSLLLFGATGLIALSGYIGWQNRDVPGATAFVVFMAWAAEWAATYGLQLLFPTLSEQLFLTNFQYPGGLLTSVTFGIFVVYYTGRDHWLTPARIAALGAIPVVTSVVVWIPELRWLVWREATLVTVNSFQIADITHGPLFHLAVAYSYLVVFAGLGLLALTTLRSQALYQKQTAMVTVAAAVPLVGGVLAYVLDLTVVDYTPVGLAVFGVGFAVALTRYQLLEVYPVPRNRILNDIDNGVLVTDADDRIVDINPAAERILSVDGVIGQRLQTIDSEAARDLLDLATGATTELVTDGDERRYFECAKSTLSAAGGFDETYLYIFSEITAQRRRQADLEAKNERLDSFAEVISHDLRNPLSVAAGSAELAEQEPETEHFERIHGAHDRMEEIIGDMLTLARSGQSVSDPEPTDVARVAREAWALVETRDASLTVEGTTTLQADPQRLQQLFENLFRNAVEHGSTNSSGDTLEHGAASNRLEADDGEAHGATGDQSVTVRVGPTESGFYVADDGPGIPSEIRDSLFASGVAADTDGAGVGLAIVDAVVDGHDWSIRAGESEDGGARFDVETGLTGG